MDTSEVYIKMCEKAEEIQELRVPTTTQSPYSFWQEGDYYFLDKEPSVYSFHWSPHHISNAVWLPRQDQLQEMVRSETTIGTATAKPESSWQLSQRFWNWLWSKEEIVSDKSMEQLWLAFVMKEKYGKVWNGDFWAPEHWRYHKNSFEDELRMTG